MDIHTDFNPIPQFSTSEPNMASAKRKNDSGLCCRPNCNNTLSDPPDTAFFGLKVCGECRRELDVMSDNIQKESDQEYVNYLSEVIKHYKPVGS